MTQFKIQLLDNNCMPERNHDTDACYDLKARCIKINNIEMETGILKSGETALVPAGFKIALEPMWEALVRPRSGLALKNGLTVLNAPGTIDADYRGEVGVILHNTSKQDFEVSKGMRIAQMAIRKYEETELISQEGPLEETKRGEKGFGSSGV